jgi:hypothetical protein
MAADTTISFRVPVAEYEAIQRASQALGESMSTYLRKSIALRLQGVVETGEYVATGTLYIQQKGPEMTRTTAVEPRIVPLQRM